MLLRRGTHAVYLARLVNDKRGHRRLVAITTQTHAHLVGSTHLDVVALTNDSVHVERTADREREGAVAQPQVNLRFGQRRR